MLCGKDSNTVRKKSTTMKLDIYGSCNGLLHLGLGVDLYLWNPLNGYFNKVLSYHQLMLDYVIRTGLCFDSSTSGYKAVMAFASFHGKFLMVGNFRRKSWKQVCFPCNVNVNVNAMRPGPVLNGRLHWFARMSTGILLNPYIFSFDPQVDKFKNQPVPKPPKDGDRDILLGLGVLDDCLCMIRDDNPTHSEGNAEIWVMKEYGVKNLLTSKVGEYEKKVKNVAESRDTRL